MNIGKITQDLLNKILMEIEKKENMEKIHHKLIDPLVGYTFRKMYPYFLSIFILIIILFLIAISILALIIRTQFLRNKF